MGGNEFALAMQCGYKQGYEDGAIAELEKIKTKINVDADLVRISYVLEIIEKRIFELKGE